MRQGLRIDANYTEDVVGFALESFITLLTFPRQRFSVEPFSRGKERWLGADARLHGRIRPKSWRAYSYHVPSRSAGAGVSAHANFWF